VCGVEVNLPNGPWSTLLGHALTVIDDMAKRGGIKDPFWTFGSGTVLMLRYEHRKSKDIDIFVPDPQYLGFATPRLSDVAAEITNDYVESAGFVKLIRPEGEIDFVAAPNLTPDPFDVWRLGGREVRVEKPCEIVAKKLWHRGDMATARDLFDLTLVIEKEENLLRRAAPYLIRHRDKFLTQIHDRQDLFKLQFEAIDTLKYKPVFEEALDTAQNFLTSL
jgi:hypothetical protein